MKSLSLQIISVGSRWTKQLTNKDKTDYQKLKPG
jgi:hypothetical protein